MSSSTAGGLRGPSVPTAPKPSTCGAWGRVSARVVHDRPPACVCVCTRGRIPGKCWVSPPDRLSRIPAGSVLHTRWLLSKTPALNNPTPGCPGPPRGVRTAWGQRALVRQDGADGRRAGICGAVRGHCSLCHCKLPAHRPAWMPWRGLPGAWQAATGGLCQGPQMPRVPLWGSLHRQWTGLEAAPGGLVWGSGDVPCPDPARVGSGTAGSPPSPFALPTSTPEHKMSAEQTRPERRCCIFKRSYFVSPLTFFFFLSATHTPMLVARPVASAMGQSRWGSAYSQFRAAVVAGTRSESKLPAHAGRHHACATSWSRGPCSVSRPSRSLRTLASR